MKKLTMIIALFVAVCVIAPSVVEATASKCRFCNSTSHGRCMYSPHKVHEHLGVGSKHCVYCGSTSYGSCIYGPTGKHRHDHGDGKCVWCGSKSVGSCIYSPHKKHEK